jgi:hypothetical protein
VPSAKLCDPVPEVDAEPVTITGRSEPPVGGQEVVLRYATEADPAPREIGRVRAADDGTFVLHDWRPPGAGHYEVAAFYAAQRPELADDFSLPRSFRMRAAAPPEQDPDPPRPPAGDPPRTTVPAHAIVLTRRLRARAGGLVAVSVTCPAAAVAPCAGRLAIRARGRVLASRGVSLAPGARRTVYVRLRPAGRRLLRRSGRVRVTVRVGAASPVRVTLRRG